MLRSCMRAAARNLSTAAAVEGKVVLRYFESRGRAQALRYALVDANTNFKDDRISMQNIMSGNWFNMKNNASISGIWGSLPVLEWDNFQLSQTEAISTFLYNKLGHAEQNANDLQLAARSASLTSFAHQDIILLSLQLINIIGTMQNAKPEDLVSAVGQFHARIHGFLPRIENLAKSNGGYLIFEAMDLIAMILGKESFNGFPHCSKFMFTMMERPNIAQYLKSGQRPLYLTGSPVEPTILARVAECRPK
ncbi:hypothetical protein GUITHDRAFT_99773 [Guillardia theta CCMP2712]|uniref:GST N-terminal domain-containing protein n=1 Tax=Guillardia theta (strain CCMP2712) TaxID=905079 RepID=L1K0E9_GUITC|nr:hypothetical protein GUITHDRAFT_99773 [Guillardia theta CCMP2712]EKX54296.1 hypothetical protein GUITHDRAFT_99773 [Guillardia theta CCMP2712]|eukprot:XP_005841276.1 hypothetical protein GUITHDRAFT_99773 [Guillardia theta CCMP2712]